MPVVRVLVVVVAMAAAGCAPRAAVGPATPPAPMASADVREQAWQNGFVTARVELPPAGGIPVPAVVTLFGQGERLRDLGIAAVTYQIHWELLRGLAPPPKPAPAPGEPQPRSWGKWMLASPDPHTVGKGYLGLIAGAATQTIPQVLDWVTALPEIDAERIGIVGISTNGFTALQAAAADRRIVAVVAIAACGDYHAFLADSSLGLAGEEPFEPTAEYEAFLRQNEPIAHPERLVHAAVLMLNGTKDTAVPIACADATADALADAYAAAGVPERFAYLRYDGAGHDLGDEARYQAMAWFARWLRDIPSGLAARAPGTVQ